MQNKEGLQSPRHAFLCFLYEADFLPRPVPGIARAESKRALVSGTHTLAYPVDSSFAQISNHQESPPLSTAISQRRLSQIAPLILQSEIRSMSVECDRIGGVNLAQGVCDTELPPPAAQGAIDAINGGLNTYTRLDGIAPLREAIAAKLAAYNGIHADPETEILVTAGATGALYTAALALLNPGDEVILFEPFYGYHWSTMLSLRAVPIAVTLDAPHWRLDIARLRASITPRTRAIIVNTPSNPCGKIFSLEELQAIAALAIEHDLFVFTDEIYEYFRFDGRRHISLPRSPAWPNAPSLSPASPKPSASPAGASATSLRAATGSQPSATSTTSSTSALPAHFNMEQSPAWLAFPARSTTISPASISRSATSSVPP